VRPIAVAQLVALAALSVPIAWISRASLRRPGTHGFYRFFAWEAILGLVVIHVRSWFRDPFSRHQVASWALLVVSFVPLVFGVRALRAHGNQATSRLDDADLLAFEKTTTLVDTGIYRYIRHPLYSSLLCLAWGLFKALRGSAACWCGRDGSAGPRKGGRAEAPLLRPRLPRVHKLAAVRAVPEGAAWASR
jgi:protein-S-isoprenylcysteine O-methyltransferase Ste14